MTDPKKLVVDGEFKMMRGVLAYPTLAYETWGEPNERGDNGVLIFTGLSPPAHVAA